MITVNIEQPIFYKDTEMHIWGWMQQARVIPSALCVPPPSLEPLHGVINISIFVPHTSASIGQDRWSKT